MEMHQVRYFLAAARTLNFTRAAEECNVTQPSLTRAIQKLEEEFGGLLFRRERSLTHLTELGRQMVPHLQRTYDAAQAAKMLAKGIGKQTQAPMTLGIAGAISPQLGVALSQVAAALPGFELSVVKADAAVLLKDMFKGEIDAAVLPEPRDLPERIDTIAFARQQFTIIAPRDGPLAALDYIGWQDLLRVPWIECDSDVVSEFRDLCTMAGVEPEFRHSARLDSDLADLVATGLGCALVPEMQPLPDTVRRIALEGFKIERMMVFATVSGRKRSAATDALARAIRARGWN
ncbi:LysR family transcriptional regulator [Blastomonas sp. SL216]|uniref:LysR family transcriptional regulator n=1 Tax=Blastomonas sp. SL216 TaxID=2995169 RepID=UPI002376D1D7|nr:LysR family transcriptional regulator [Blastomonas sp. SL216]